MWVACTCYVGINLVAFGGTRLRGEIEARGVGPILLRHRSIVLCASGP